MAEEFNTSLVFLRQPSIKVFEHEGRDVHKDTLKTARDIGRVRLNHTRLNVFSYLAEGDKEDHYKFQIQTKGGLRLGTWRDAGTRIQILTDQGRLIADSKLDAGRYHDKYARIIGGVKGGEPFEPGTYYIKVSRLKLGETTPERAFSLQIQMGETVLRDFDTKEYKAKEFKPGDIKPFDPTEGATNSAATIQGALMVNTMVVGMQFLKFINNKVFNLFTTTLNR